MDIITAAQNAKQISPAMAQLSGELKNAALREIAARRLRLTPK